MSVSKTSPNQEIIEKIKTELNDTDDLVIREIQKNGEHISLVFIDTLIDEIKLKSYVLEPLSQQNGDSWRDILLSKSVEETESFHIIIDDMMKGHCALISNNSPKIHMLDIASTNSRPIQESLGERVVKGAHDGFIENIVLNIYQIRKRIENKKLTVKYKVKGDYTKSKIAILYVDDLVNKKVLAEVERRLNSISLDFLQNPGSIIESIEDSPYSPFPQMLHTERPDRAAASLMDGKVVLVLDGSPVVLILPSTFFAFYQSSEDYNSRWYMSSTIRLLRLAGFIISLTLPGLYIALVGIHHELIPTELIFPLQASINKVPLPPLAEAIIMQLTIELIREVAIRLPTQVSVTIGLVGATLIGQAVVAASLLSNIIIIIIAFTAIASFAAPSLEISNTTRLLGFPLMILAYFFGLLGITFGLFLIIFHLCSLRSFGTPYFSPLAPVRPKEYSDTIIRVPFWRMNRRESDIKTSKHRKEFSSRSWQINEE